MLLSLSAMAALAADADCIQLDTADLPALEGCRQTAPGTLQISAAVLSRLDFDSDGLAVIYVPGQHYYVRRDGRYLPVITYDNGPDYFAEGLTRGVIDGKLGYYDAQLRPAFDTRFDWGWPFENGIAEVCEGCRPGKRDADGHTSIVGGRHFRIDRRGNPVSDPR